ncbi:MAG: SDR family oxidoreductase [Prevotella sp.]|nr:SDR family oxidoreductase [Prevotella sp.]
MKDNPFSLQGKTVVITGASSGLGRECAFQCSRMGAKIVALGRNEQRLNDLTNSLEGEGHKMWTFDLTNLDDINNLVNDIHDNYGKIDGFVHSAGVEKTAPSKLLSPSDYENLLRVNTISAFEFIRQLCQVKYFNHGGSVILIASITALIARNGLTAYSASKGALISGARTLALEYAKRRIRVNTISPGTIKTPLMEQYLSTLSESDREKRLAGFPLGIGNPSDIAHACVYLLSDASQWMTGQNLIIDGGYTIK